MIQGNVLQDDKRDPRLQASILGSYLSASRDAAAVGA
jgi:hypothetical protein